jgi:hypothetical protein
MPKVWKEAIVGMDGIMELPKRSRSLLIGTLLPSVNNLNGEAKRSEVLNYLACMKHEQGMHEGMGKADNYNCAGGFEPGPLNQPKHI